MQLESSGLGHITPSSVRAVGFRMCVEGADPVRPVRVLVTYEALSHAIRLDCEISKLVYWRPTKTDRRSRPPRA
jgi:hypothetical protein